MIGANYRIEFADVFDAVAIYSKLMEHSESPFECSNRFANSSIRIDSNTLCPRKKVNLCCHNSGKQRRIFTKFYTNTETFHCKQVTKFQQNQSTSATATASLVRSLKSRVHYRHTRVWLSNVHPCEWQDFSTSKVCVRNVHRVLEVERKLQDVDATAWPLHRWPPGRNVPTLRSGTSRTTSACRRHESGCGTHAQLPPNLVVDRVKVGTVGWPRSWSDEVWCFMS